LYEKIGRMKKIYYTLMAFFFFPLYVAAQQDHFIYLQTENNVPFYIKTGSIVTSSSNSGYLIISKLKDGEYKMIIGSPRNEWPEQQVTYKVDNKDAGYLIKNFGNKGLGLYNLQTYNVVMAESVAVDNSKPATQNNDNAFSNMLANVVNDSTIKEKDIIPEPPAEKVVVKEEKEKAVPKEEVKEAAKPTVEQPQPTDVKVAEQPVNSLLTASVIKRKLRKKGKDGTELVYVDEHENNRDTIRIFIPAEKAGDEIKDDTAKAADAISEKKSEPVATPDTVVQEKSEPLIHVDTVYVVPVTPQKKQVKEQKPLSQPVFIDDKSNEKNQGSGISINSDCKAYATEDDFFKLRKKMAAEKNDEAMVKVAKKVFKSKCFSTDQVKNLSNLFLHDEGRYNFFDTAYPFVSDSAIFSTLENQLTDPYYITRFKAMIHH
jgi:hypothetical protein